MTTSGDNKTLKASFTVSDNNLATKARSRTFNFSLTIQHYISGMSWISQRNVIYNNPCDKASSFFHPVAVSPIHDILHIPGIYTVQHTVMSTLFTDSVGNPLCDAARQYTINDTTGIQWSTFSWDGVIVSQLNTQLSSSQVSEITTSINVMVELKIGANNELVDQVNSDV